MKDLLSEVKSNERIAENIYMITLTLPEDAGAMHGGQFANLSTGNGQHLLRRPLGICKVDGSDISLCYQVKGGGTRYLSTVPAGAKLQVLLPLGNWFDLEEYKSVAVIGGGVGIFPLIRTVAENAPQKDFYCYMGFRNKNAVCLLNELSGCKKLTVTTDDGSYGAKGNAVEAYLREADNIPAEAIIACGPPIMLSVLKRELSQKGFKIPCFVSLEERMGCGMGACLVCVCRLEDGSNARVCRDGPVFSIQDVKL